MMNEAETLSGKEHQKERAPLVSLAFFRHEERAPFDADGYSREAALTPNGREKAIRTGGSPSEDAMNRSLAIASPVWRAQQTALLRAFGDKAEEYSSNDPAVYSGQRTGGNKRREAYRLLVDTRLDYQTESGVEGSNDEYLKQLGKALKEGNLFRWAVYESDACAKRFGDTASSTFSRLASGIAAIILKYGHISENLASRGDFPREAEDAKKFQIFRFAGTHQVVAESFLAKVIQKTDGDDALGRFVAALDNTGGFSFGEGFAVIIGREGNRVFVHIDYESGDKSFHFSKDVDLSVIRNIYEEH